MKTLLDQAKDEIFAAEIHSALEDVRIKYLGKTGILQKELQSLRTLSHKQRPIVGKLLNEQKQELTTFLQLRKKELEQTRQNQLLDANRIDITLAGRERKAGSWHPVSYILEHIQKLFLSAGYELAVGPEIEDTYHNFDALNILEQHPARAMHDTFHIDEHENLVLRTHTSPVQIRVLESTPLPLHIICPGKVYRVDSDLTHTPMFHQIEGLVIDQNISFVDLKGTILNFLHSFFERKIKTRFRPSYFPFTEPSAEVDIECTRCRGQGCKTCSNSGWLEVLGCGMVHPNVLTTSGVDTEVYNGFAFGLGVERLTMLLYKIDDLRMFYANDLDFLEQFSR